MQQNNDQDTRRARTGGTNQRLAGLTGSREIIEETMLGGPAEDPLARHGCQMAVEPDNEYYQLRSRNL